MSDETDVSDQPVIFKTDVETSHGTTLTIHQAYTPPLDGSFDSYEAVDRRLANAVYAVLKRHYWGYEWDVKTELRQGLITFRLPELLMGRTLHAFVRLADYNDLSDKLIMRLAGDLLERMGLPRTEVDMDAYEAAKFRIKSFDFGDVKQ